MSTQPVRTAVSALSTAAGPSNLSSAERWMSGVAGLGLAIRALRGGGSLSRLLWASAGLSLLARGATGYCAVKGALAGETTLAEGVKQQFRRLQTAAAGDTVSSIDDLASLYAVELQELHSAETQFARLIERTVPMIQSAALSLRLEEYATELQARQVDLEGLLARATTDTRPHADDAMRALLHETHKMARLCAPALRDAAVVASLQRILHYKIAGYGTIAAYAKSLGRVEQAAHFAELADRDKAVEGELSSLAEGSLNPDANAVASETQPPGSLRTH